MRAIVAIALKDLRLLVRDRVALFWVLVFPVLFALFLGTVLETTVAREQRPLVVAFVDEPSSAAGAALRQSLDAAPELALKPHSLSEAQAAVRRGDIPAYVRVLPQLNASTPLVELGMDPAQKQAAAIVANGLEVALTRGAGAPHSPKVRVQSVLPDASRPRSAFDIVFPAAILWGLMGCVATFAIAMVGERVGGTLDRLRVAPISSATVLGGKALACFGACILDSVVLLVIARYAFDVRPERPLLLCLVLPCVALCFVGIMLLLGQIGRTVESVAGAGWSTLIVLAMLGGAMVPLSAMPDWMQLLSSGSPVKWGIRVLEGVIWRGLSIAELASASALLVLTGVVTFLIAWNRSGLRSA